MPNSQRQIRLNSRLNIRQRQTPWARHALGVFVVMWLNLILQPCAMAFGGGPDQDCPNCPPAHSQHDGHEMASMKMADHGVPCAGSIADCGGLEDLNFDGRNAQLKVKDAPHDSPVAVSPFADITTDIKPARHAYLRPIQRHPPGPPKTLNKLYCVYLK